MKSWKRKKPVWALVKEDGELHHFCGSTHLFLQKRDAVAAFKAYKVQYKFVRIVKVLVKYEEIRL